MSNTLVLNTKEASDVNKSIPIPSYYKDQYGAYYAIISSDMAISIYSDTKYPTICITRPKHLLEYCAVEVPIEKAEFWRTYNEVEEATKRQVAPYNTLTC